MENFAIDEQVKNESTDVKTEYQEVTENREDNEGSDEYEENVRGQEVHTVVLQNIQIAQGGQQFPIILNQFPSNNSDGNLHIDTMDQNVIHTYIIDNTEFNAVEGHEIVYEDIGDDENAVQYVIEDGGEFEIQGQMTQFNDEAMRYTYQVEEIDGNVELAEADKQETAEVVESQIEEQESKIEMDQIKEEHVECDICQKVFRTSAGLKRHITVNHCAKSDMDGSDPLTLQLCPCCGEPSDSAHTIGDINCEQCGKLFVQMSCLQRHLSIEHPEGDEFTCAECKKVFKTKEGLIDHMKVHPIKTVKCLDCNREFTRKYHLDRHIGQTGCMGYQRKAYDCRVCKRFFTRKDNLAEHLRAHAGQAKKKKKYQCEFCDKEFQGFALLNVHIRTHTGEKPYSCDFCPKKFPSGGAMKKHRRMHTGEKPYKCDKCDKKFAAKETLNRHWRTHTGEKPHQCQFCGKSFIQPSQLRAHIFHHTGENAYTCQYCGRAFNRRLRLTTHIKFMHEGADPLPCPHCDKTFFRKEDVARHILCHTGDKPFACDVCQKRFSVKSSLKIHQLTHKKEPPCVCETCGRAFIRKDCLMRHIRARHRDVLEDILANAEKKRLQQQLLAAATDAASLSNVTESIIWNELTLTESIKELLTLLVDEECLMEFGYPESPVDRVLDCVIRRCGYKPASEDDFDYLGRIRENAKLLFTVVIDDEAVKELLNNQTVDEVILHVLRLAKKQGT
nr:protein suppressor of hairy wing [Leptinotarsa decemlineata]